MKILPLALISLFVACSASNTNLLASGMISKQQAIDIAKEEINRHHIKLPKGCKVVVVEDIAIVEFGSDIPVYVVSFNDPHRTQRIPLYDVEVNRKTGKVRSFGDFHIIKR